MMTDPLVVANGPEAPPRPSWQLRAIELDVVLDHHQQPQRTPVAGTEKTTSSSIEIVSMTTVPAEVVPTATTTAPTDHPQNQQEQPAAEPEPKPKRNKDPPPPPPLSWIEVFVWIILGCMVGCSYWAVKSVTVTTMNFLEGLRPTTPPTATLLVPVVDMIPSPSGETKNNDFESTGTKEESTVSYLSQTTCIGPEDELLSLDAATEATTTTCDSDEDEYDPKLGDDRSDPHHDSDRNDVDNDPNPPPPRQQFSSVIISSIHTTMRWCVRSTGRVLQFTYQHILPFLWRVTFQHILPGVWTVLKVTFNGTMSFLRELRMDIRNHTYYGPTTSSINNATTTEDNVFATTTPSQEKEEEEVRIIRWWCFLLLGFVDGLPHTPYLITPFPWWFIILVILGLLFSIYAAICDFLRSQPVWEWLLRNYTRTLTDDDFYPPECHASLELLHQAMHQRQVAKTPRQRFINRLLKPREEEEIEQPPNKDDNDDDTPKQIAAIWLPPLGHSRHYSRAGNQRLVTLDEPCMICWCEFKPKDRIVWSSNGHCKHIYHTDCLFKWFGHESEYGKCPVCRSEYWRKVQVVVPTGENTTPNADADPSSSPPEAPAVVNVVVPREQEPTAATTTTQEPRPKQQDHLPSPLLVCQEAQEQPEYNRTRSPATNPTKEARRRSPPPGLSLTKLCVDESGHNHTPFCFCSSSHDNEARHNPTGQNTPRVVVVEKNPEEEPVEVEFPIILNWTEVRVQLEKCQEQRKRRKEQNDAGNRS